MIGWVLWLVFGWGLLSFVAVIGWAGCRALARRRRQARTDSAELNDLGVYLARRALR